MLKQSFIHLLKAAILIAPLLTAMQALPAQCLTGPGNPNITGNVPFGPPINWANPNRVEISDNLYARTSLNAGQISKYLLVKDFQFILPPAATILGIQAAVERHTNPGSFLLDNSVRLTKGGLISGNDYASAAFWPSVDEVKGYGGSSDLWGQSWTAADIMNPGFGLVISVKRTMGIPNLSAFIDNINLTVYYDDGTGCVLGQMVQALKAEPIEENSLSLTWNLSLPEMAGGISVERSDDGLHFYALEILSQNEREVRIEHIGTGYHHFRIGVNAAGYGKLYSNIVTVWTGTNEKKGLELAPNPASTSVQVRKADCGSPCRASIIDLNGKEIGHYEMEDGSTFSSLDIAGLDPGLYVMKMGSNGEYSETRFGVTR